jgi:hypothetical protein
VNHRKWSAKTSKQDRIKVGDDNEMSGQRFVIFLEYTMWHITEKIRYERGRESKYRTACTPMMIFETVW